MAQQKQLWKIAKLQADQIPRLKDAKAKNRQIVLLCQTLTKALKGSDHA